MPKTSNTRRKDGRIAVSVYLGMVDGKRKYKTLYGKTQKEADAAADALRARLRKGLDPASRSDTFGVWCDRWMAIKKTDIGHSQYQSYQSYTKHLRNTLEHIPIDRIRSYDIQLIISALAENNPNSNKPAGKKTLTDIRNTAVQIFALAVDNRVLDYNPALSVKIPRGAPTTTRRALTADEQRWILDTPHRMRLPAMIMMYSGLRRGELIPLQWSDVDLAAQTISVNKTVDLSGAKPLVKPTGKTAAAMRTVHIPQILVDLLTREPKVSVLVCPGQSGRIYNADDWRNAWDAYLYDLDIKYGKTPQRTSKYDNRFRGISIPRITPHWLRHTFCTMLYLAGVDVLTAKAQMGHSDVKTTLSIYTHLTNEHAQRDMQKLDDFIGRQSNASQILDDSASNA